MTQPCYTGPTGTENVGACVAGSQTCVSGQWDACNGDVVSIAETCNGVDDDCDTQVDEDFGIVCCGVGACLTTVSSCIEGQSFTCTPGTPEVEICDGIDNDCNGITDDSILGVGYQCGISQGICTQGTWTCTKGAWSCQDAISPEDVEICNGLDDDCNGQTDDNPTDAGMGCGVSNNNPCKKGTQQCLNGVLQCIGATNPTAEFCDGIDNNCDGVIDEGMFPTEGNICGSDEGECVAGVIDCTAGKLDCAGDVGPKQELCNGLDDDCDGFIDEGTCPPFQTCAQGKCIP